jgi:hypothetical protein
MKDAEGIQVSALLGSTAKQQVIETASGFRDQRADLEPESLFNHLLLLFRSGEASISSGSFLSFVPFMLFLFRLLESPPTVGVQSRGAAATRPAPRG